MDAKRFTVILLALLLVPMLVLSACGTLEIEREVNAPPVEATVAASTAAEPTVIVEPTDVATADVTVAADTVMPTMEVIPTPTEPPVGDEGQAKEDQPVTKSSEIVTLDETWSRYTNYQMGFSINFPRTMIHFFGSCKWNEENGDHSYRPELSYVPVKIFEDDDSVFISSEFYHQLSGETKETSADGGTRTFFSECQAIANNLDLLRDPDNHYQNKWEIVSQEVHSDEDLDDFIKARYGSGCSLDQRAASGQDGVYDVTIQGDGKDLSETLCPLNYGTVVKYYPEGNQAIAWDTGQAPTFAADTTYSVIHDQEMIDSFTFLTGSSIDAPG